MEPDLGRDFTVATVLTAAIVALATGSLALGALVLAAAAALLAITVFARSRPTSARSPRSH